MLVLSRKPGEKLVLAEGITVTILEVAGRRVRIGIDAPDEVPILRGERACWLELDTPESPRLSPIPA
jgi:carbon storage regulator